MITAINVIQLDDYTYIRDAEGNGSLVTREGFLSKQTLSLVDRRGGEEKMREGDGREKEEGKVRRRGPPPLGRPTPLLNILLFSSLPFLFQYTAPPIETFSSQFS